MNKKLFFHIFFITLLFFSLLLAFWDKDLKEKHFNACLENPNNIYCMENQDIFKIDGQQSFNTPLEMDLNTYQSFIFYNQDKVSQYNKIVLLLTFILILDIFRRNREKIKTFLLKEREKIKNDVT